MVMFGARQRTEKALRISTHLDAIAGLSTAGASIEIVRVGDTNNIVLGMGGTKVVSSGDVQFAGALEHDGVTLGLYGVTPGPRSPQYVVINVSNDRLLDADSTSTAELADVLGTLISDLKATGIIG